VTGFLAVLLLPLLAQQQPRPAIDSARAAREAVARFFAWYVPASQRAGADMRALHDSRWHFDPALVAALRADSAATSASPDEIVGLDMDPFLNSQDPCDRYAPTAVRRDGSTFLVDVVGSGGCEAHREPDVTVRVAFRGTTPVFVNFLYPKPANSDLLAELAQLAADRAKKPRRSSTRATRAEIDRSAAETDAALSRMRRAARDLFGQSTEGAQVALYSAGDTLKKVVVMYYGESGRASECFYVRNGRVQRFARMDARYARPMSGRIQSSTFERAWLDADSLVFWQDSLGRTRHSAAERAEKALDIRRSLRTLLDSSTVATHPRDRMPEVRCG
jgi:hypothetical protein